MSWLLFTVKYLSEFLICYQFIIYQKIKKYQLKILFSLFFRYSFSCFRNFLNIRLYVEIDKKHHEYHSIQQSPVGEKQRIVA